MNSIRAWWHGAKIAVSVFWLKFRWHILLVLAALGIVLWLLSGMRKAGLWNRYLGSVLRSQRELLNKGVEHHFERQEELTDRLDDLSQERADIDKRLEEIDERLASSGEENRTKVQQSTLHEVSELWKELGF